MSSGGSILELDRVWKLQRRWRRRPVSLKEALIRRAEYEEFWALRAVSLAVRPGEQLGFCGPNGAGKSTLLRIVAGIVPPTRGRITVRGRTAAMLELGAGFLGDLTGRENIALAAALLGLGPDDILRKADAIVEFAGLGDFIDSPLRTYSTGMYMRLGFAVAGNVEADLVLLDEVLAVGDAEFQGRCAEWLAARRRAGTTVLLVSHDLAALERTCDRVVWLDRGELRGEGPPREIVERYAASSAAAATHVPGIA